MPAKAKKPAKPPVTEVPHSGEAWRPHVDSEPEFNPFASSGASGDGRTHFGENAAEAAIRDATENTAPLEGTRDLTDADSLGGATVSTAEASTQAKPRRVRASRSRPARKRAAKTRRPAARRTASAKRRAGAKRAKSVAKAKGAPRVRRASAGRGTRGRRKSVGRRR